MVVQANTKKNFCNICNKTITNLKIHYDRVHNESRQYFECNICKKTVSDLEQHKNVHKEKPKEFWCKICERGFSIRNNFISHSEIHESVQKYECDKCGKKFSRKSYLAKHKKVLHGHVEKLKCQLCDKILSRPQVLKSHMMTQHEGLKAHKCKICGKDDL